MTVVFLSRFFGPHIGGVEKHVGEVGKRLVEQGHRLMVITENLPDSKPEEKIDGVKVIRMDVGENDWFKKFRIWWWLWGNRKLIKEADIIHCHDVFFWYLPFRFLYPQKPVYTTFHGYEDYPISQKAILVRKISEKLSFGNICIGDFIKKWYGTKPTFISYGGVNFSKSDGGKYQNESAVFIGRLDKQTGILTYIKAFKLIKKVIPSFKFTVVGDGELKNKLDDSINFKGFKDNPELYLQSHHFAFVSRYLSIFEAMVAKRLVFANFDNPLKEDYLKMAPFAKWIIIESDPQKLAGKVKYFLEHPEEEKLLVEEGYNWSREQTWEKVTNLYLSLWQQ